jgi:hypothetical protein
MIQILMNNNKQMWYQVVLLIQLKYVQQSIKRVQKQMKLLLNM